MVRSGRFLRAWWFLLVVVIGIVTAARVLGPWWGGDQESKTWAAVARAQADLKSGSPARALAGVERVSDRGPWEADLLTVKGLALAALNRPEDARPLLERSLSLKPGQPMVAKVLAAVYFASIQTDRGFEMLKRAARLDPEDYRPWYAAGEILLHVLNRPEDAERSLSEALRRRPDHDESRIDLIEALLALGRMDEATSLLEPALRDRPDEPRLLQLATRQARLAGRPDEMNRYAERVLALDPGDAEALLTRGQYYRMTGRPLEALADAERAVALNPDDPASLNLLVGIEGFLGYKDRAGATGARLRAARDRAERLGVLQEQITARPDDPEPRWRLGQAAAESGKRDLAITSFRAALILDPRCRPALDGLAGVLARSSGR